MTERELLVDCLKRLNGNEISYMLTGSMVSNYWGIPRTTHDLDFVVQLPEQAIPPLLRAFQGDFFLDEAALRSALRHPPFQFNAIDMRSPLKVAFWLLQPRPFERNMFERRMEVRLFGEPAWICTAEDVILHKLYWNSMTPSERQIGDAVGVFSVQGSTLDSAYLRRWAAELDVGPVLEDILAGRIRPKTT